MRIIAVVCFLVSGCMTNPSAVFLVSCDRVYGIVAKSDKAAVDGYLDEIRENQQDTEKLAAILSEMRELDIDIMSVYTDQYYRHDCGVPT